MNQEKYHDPTADSAVGRADQELRKARHADLERMQDADMVYVLIPGLEGLEGETVREKQRTVMNYIIHRGSVPCLNEMQRLMPDPEMDERLYHLRGAHLMDACREVWVFGTRKGEYTRRTREEIRRAKEKGKIVRSIYFDGMSEKKDKAARCTERRKEAVPERKGGKVG